MRRPDGFHVPESSEDMSEKSSIEWTDATWNPVRGCTKISPGCKHCYAETFAERFRGVRGHPYEQGFDLKLIPEKLAEPIKWAQPKTIFVNSMSDLFHEDVPDWYVEQVARIMAMANWHTYQVLTKRADRLRKMLVTKLAFAAKLNHIWWGVSVEDKKFGKPRIAHLKAACAAMKFLSVEPLLEDLGEVDFSGLDWVIVGGESGNGARRMEESWVLNVKKNCRRANVPFFFKQWGGVRKSETGRTLQGKTFDEMPERTHNSIPSKPDRLSMIADVTEWTQPSGNVPVNLLVLPVEQSILPLK
jgi:protein gp37